TPSQPGNVAGRRSGLREDPAGLNFPTPTNTHPRHHKKPHNPNPPHTRHTPFPTPTPNHPATISTRRTDTVDRPKRDQHSKNLRPGQSPGHGEREGRRKKRRGREISRRRRRRRRSGSPRPRPR